MITFEVGALFSISAATALDSLKEIGNLFTALQGQISAFQSSLDALGKGETLFTGLKAGFTEVGTVIEGLGTKAEAAVTVMSGAFDRGVLAAQAAAEKMSAAFSAVNATPIVAPVGAGEGRGGSRSPADKRFMGFPVSPNEIPEPSRPWNPRPVNEFGGFDLRTNEEVSGGSAWNPSGVNTGPEFSEFPGFNTFPNRVPPSPPWDPGMAAAVAAAERENAAVAEARARRDAAAAGAIGGVARGMGPLIGGLAPFAAEKVAMEEDRALAQVLQEAGFNEETDPRFKGLMEELRGRVEEGSTGTIYSHAKTAKALPGTMGSFGAMFDTPEERLRNYETFLPYALRFSEVGEQFHRGGIDANFQAAISWAHMKHQYGGPPGSKEEAAMEKSLDRLFYTALSTKETIAAEQKILKYDVPLGMAAGLTADDTAAITAFFQMIGFSGTTAATGFGQMLMGLASTGGPVAAQLHQRQPGVEDALKHALNLDPAKMHELRKKGGKPHVEAMKALGLYDEHGQVREDVAPRGVLNKDAFFGHIEHAIATHTPMQNLEMLRDAFTVRGSRQAAMLTPDMVGKLTTYLRNVQEARSVVDLQKESQDRPLSQFEQMLANISNIGNTLATTTLDPLNTALQRMNTLLIGFNAWLEKHQVAAEALGWGSLAVGGAAALGVGASAVGMLWRKSGAASLWKYGKGLMSPEAAGADALGQGLLGEGAEAGAYAVGGVTVPLLALGASMLAAGAYSGSKNAPMLDDYGRRLGTWGGGPTPPPQNNFDINVGPITVVPEISSSTFDMIMKKIGDKLKNALPNSTGPAQGTPASPYTTFGFG